MEELLVVDEVKGESGKIAERREGRWELYLERREEGKTLWGNRYQSWMEEMLS